MLTKLSVNKRSLFSTKQLTHAHGIWRVSAFCCRAV